MSTEEEMKYKIGQKVRAVKPERVTKIKGAEGVIVGFNTVGDYCVDFPDYRVGNGTTEWFCKHYQIEPILYDGKV